MKFVSKEDGGWYGWIIVLACHCVDVLMLGLLAGMGVFMVEFMEYFGEGAGRTALIQSILIGCMTFPASLISSLNNKSGTRPLVIIGGVISSGGLILSSFANSINVLLLNCSVLVGIGYGLIYGPSIILVGRYFHKRHALANGIAQSGVAVGVMTFPLLYQILIDKYGWRGAMLVMAGINMNLVVCGMLMRSPLKYYPEPIDETLVNITQQYSTVDPGKISFETVETFKNNELEETNNIQNLDVSQATAECCETAQNTMVSLNVERLNKFEITLSKIMGLHLFKKSWFHVLCISGFLAGIGHNTTMFHFVAKAVSVGTAKMDSAILMTIMGVCSLIGRATHGLFVDTGLFSPMFITSCAWLLAGVSLMFILVANSNYLVLAFIAAIYGISSGTAIPLHGAVCMKACFGKEDLSSAFGWFLTCSSIGNIFGPPTAGLIYDITSNYNLSFVLASSTLLLLSLLIFMQISYKRCQSGWKFKKELVDKPGCHGNNDNSTSHSLLPTEHG
ncbi:monocarboxylate transporter 12-like [Saccoglossus kowalevskii]|uniref:Monocarboxylate transporter 13-like n=1 Tax=Saccoglossus kowalevskii TaxID=10224 RepID=A0ABM0MBR2_SACKO|nr:PREDICTED: monocarboxylate transporter 13-like [Saccoglossus kowalevskii]